MEKALLAWIYLFFKFVDNLEFKALLQHKHDCRLQAILALIQEQLVYSIHRIKYARRVTETSCTATLKCSEIRWVIQANEIACVHINVCLHVWVSQFNVHWSLLTGMCIFQKKTLIMCHGVWFKTHYDFISMSKYGLHSPDNRHMQSTTNPIAHAPSAQTLPTNRPTPPPYPSLFHCF